MHGDHRRLLLRPSHVSFAAVLHLRLCALISAWLTPQFTKEVIRPQVPLRPPCYDFSPLAELWFDAAK